MRKFAIAVFACILCFLTLTTVFAEPMDQWEQFWQEPVAPDPQRPLSEYAKVDYKTAVRSLNSYLEIPLRFNGEVWGFDAYGDNAIFGVRVGRDESQILLCFAENFSNWKWENGASIERLLPGDSVTVYGYLYNGLETEMDEYPYVPLFRVANMTLHE